jgi:hypothetical protein
LLTVHEGRPAYKGSLSNNSITAEDAFEAFELKDKLPCR